MGKEKTGRDTCKTTSLDIKFSLKGRDQDLNLGLCSLQCVHSTRCTSTWLHLGSFQRFSIFFFFRHSSILLFLLEIQLGSFVTDIKTLKRKS